MPNSTEGFRLSPQQTHLWSLEQAGAGLNFPALCAVELTGELDEGRLKSAFGEIVRRHEILRTLFQRPAGLRIPFQVVVETLAPSWRVIDLSTLTAAEQQTKAHECLAEARSQSFDLEHGPVLRVTLIRRSDARHVLIISLPALCADSRTLANIVRELGQAYDSRVNNAELAAEPMQYADFAEWQNELLEATDDLAREGKRFWEESFAASPKLPLERPAELAVVTDQCVPSSVPLAFDAELLKRIAGLALAHDASVSSLLFACWQALVWRLSGTADFVLFDLCDGRKFDDLQEALGLYARYLPVRCQVADRAFAELLRAAHETRNESREWLEYFDPTSMSAPLREAVAFEFSEQERVFAVGGLQFSVLTRQACLGAAKLKLSFVHDGDLLSGELQYDPQRFGRETIERMAGYFQQIAQTIVDGSAQQPAQSEVNATTIGAIDILSNEERERLLIGYNQTAAAFPADKCIHELFEAQVAKSPEAIALVCDDRQLTYRELNARANQLAHLLRRRGLAASDRVGLCTERGVEMIVGLLGILKAGGAYVPLNPEHPAERLALQLTESKAALLVTAAGTIGSAPQLPAETVDLNLHASLLANEPETNPSPLATLKDLVYVIYTSGSTGIPKGVAATQGNLINYTQFILRRLQVSTPLQFASVSTISADLGNTCIFPSLVSGGCLHILSYEVAMSGELFRNYTEQRPIEVLKIVPSHLNALLAAEPEGRFLPSQYLICGGEALSWEMAQRISRLNPACRIINHYGPTETTVGSLTYDVDSQKIPDLALTVPIGRPIANTRAYVLDDYLRPTPTGVAGELFIGGAGVTAGYLNQPAETAARFIADPFTPETGARLYRTGDLVRYLADSNIEFLGRVDHQVKVRGFRVELGEIEAVLTSHPSVRQAVVVSGDERLVAYLISAVAKPVTTDELRSLLRQKLPEYMVPAAFVFLKSLPLTANGKIDRAALSAPDDLHPELARVLVAPRTPVETALAEIWAELLKVSEVGVHDNFFDLGGHSLLATQVVSRMRQTFQLEISLRSLFESPTVAALAAIIEETAARETARLLAELEDLSEEEAELLLKQEQPPSSDVS